MRRLNLSLKSNPVVYVTRDLERALGLPLDAKNYYIITNESDFAKGLAKNHKNLLLVKAKIKLDTRELLERPAVVKLVNNLPQQNILVFKNTPQIEKICAARGWKLLNPSAALAAQVEEKTSQLKWLGTLKKYLPPRRLIVGEKLTFQGEPFIVQFNRAHTGSGTILVDSQKTADEIKNKFPQRALRVTKFIYGPALTNNNVVWGKKILLGNISYQITGIAPFTTLPFSTIGNDWALPRELLNNQQIKRYRQMCVDIGKKLAASGWKGLFGVDAICDEDTGKIYLIEINARQPASTTYESQLQESIRKTVTLTRRLAKNNLPDRQNDKVITTFEAHLAALLNLPPARCSLQSITNGAQIIKRLQPGERLNQKKITGNLVKQGFNIISYNTTEPEKDWLRVQSPLGIMSEHNEFNSLGQAIVQSIIICSLCKPKN